MTIRTKLLTSVAALTLVSGAAFADQHTAANADAEANTEMNAAADTQYAPGWNQDLDSAYGDIADRQIAELIGMNVVTDGGDDVGEVDNFVIIEEQLKAVVGVGGFLGLGEHHVALALSDLTYDGDRLVIPFTAEELEAMPEYTEELEQQRLAEGDTFRTRSAAETDMAAADATAEGEATAETETDMAAADATAEGEATAETETDMAAADATAEGEALTEEDSTAMNMADGDLESDADEASAPSGEDVAAAEEAAGDQDTMTEEVAEDQKGEIEQEAEEVVAEADAATEEATAEAEQMADNAAEATENAAEETEQMADNAAAETEQAVEEAGTEVAEAGEEAEAAVEEGTEEVADAAEATGEAVEEGAEDVAQSTENAAEETGDWLAKFAEAADWTAADIEGKSVATANGDVIGEIDDLGMQGDQLVAVVGIGGFLGLGEHDVALDIQNMSWDGEKFIADGYSEEELKGMAEFDPETLEPLDADVTLRSQANL